MKAVVMAGGEGSRLRPLTLNCPKPLVPVANKPTMLHILELLKRHGVDEVIVTLHYLAGHIQNAFSDGSDLGLTLRYTVEKTPLGTAGSVKQAEEWLKDEPFLIISGDALTDADLSRFMEFHRDRRSDATLGLVERPSPLEYGVVVTDQEGVIKRFLEKPDWTEAFSNTINSGIYCLDPVVFRYMEPGVAYDWSHDIFPRMLEEGKRLHGVLLDGYWSDIGSIQTYREAQADALSGKVRLELPSGEVMGRSPVGEDAFIDPDAVIRGTAIIGEGARIKSGAVIEGFTVIGDRCVVESGARVADSILWNDVYVGEGAKIEGSIVLNQSYVGAKSSLEDGAIIGEKSHLHPASSIGANVKVWPQKTIEAGIRLSRSLITGNKWSGSLFTGGTVLGIPNLEITPEFVTDLAGAFGASLPPGSSVAIGRDSHPVCRMIKHALMTGLLSSGIDILDLHTTPEPISRYMTKTTPASAGIHVHVCACMSGLVSISFFNEDGLSVSSAVCRKIEDRIGREAFRRMPSSSIGRILVTEEAAQRYIRGLKEIAPVPLLRNQFSRIVLDCAYGTVSSVAPALMEELGCPAIAVNAVPNVAAEPRTDEKRNRMLEDLSSMVPNLGAELGALLTDDATTLHLADDKGYVLSSPNLFMAYIDLILRSEPGAVIVVPDTAPSQLESLIQRRRGRIIRAPNSERDLIATAVRENAVMGGDLNGRFVFPHLHNAFDGVAALIEVVKRLNQLKVRLSDIVASLPPFHLAHALVPFSWDQKSEILQRLEEIVGEKDSGNGIRQYYEGGWVYIVEDSTMPAFHVHAQADDPARLNTVMNHYIACLKDLSAKV
jgi:mannose-1-phosphate guanylyltransferase/phosphomannomutase